MRPHFLQLLFWDTAHLLPGQGKRHGHKRRSGLWSAEVSDPQGSSLQHRVGDQQAADAVGLALSSWFAASGGVPVEGLKIRITCAFYKLTFLGSAVGHVNHDLCG